MTSCPYLRLKIVAGLTVLLLFPIFSAQAHVLQLSDSELALSGNRATWMMRVHLGNFDAFFKGADAAAVRDFFANRAKIKLGGSPCRLLGAEVARDAKAELFAWKGEYECPNGNPPLEVDYNIFYGDYNHRHLLKVKAFDRAFSETLSPERSHAQFTADSPSRTFLDFLHLGLEHILIGFDHILFVLTLILGARRIKTLLLLVTAFTLAHSISLALSTLGIFTLSPKLVEPLIAASILLVAAQDFFAKDEPNLKLMLLLTFGFGLIHGLGFSYVLQEANLTGGHLLLPLFSFNLGVEFGQLCIVMLVYPLTRLLARTLGGRYLTVKRILLAAIALVAVYWLVERLFLGPAA